MTTAVSVALCTHNGERFIESQLQSILQQSLPARQVVLSDDASTDATLDRARAVVARFRASRPEVDLEFTIIENTVPLGVTANFEQAILACDHELIALSDQDDVWLPDRLLVQTAAFDDPRVALSHSDARLIDENGAVLEASLLAALEASPAQLSAIDNDRALDVFLQRNLVTGATAMVRRELALLAAPFPSAWVHDEWLAIVAAATARIALIRQPLIDYRQHSANQIGASSLSLIARFGRLVEPGAERNRRLLMRAEQLAERFSAMQDVIDAAVIREVIDKLAHERVRSGIPKSRIRRPVRVLGEWRTGRYSRYGHGLADVARDLIQPLKTDG